MKMVIGLSGKKILRQRVFEKWGGRCAYCGKQLEFKAMQIDHITPKQHRGDDDFDNLNPACRSCNHYKRANNLEVFRESMFFLHKRVSKIYICRIAEDYGIIRILPWDGKFYFEKVMVGIIPKEEG